MDQRRKLVILSGKFSYSAYGQDSNGPVLFRSRLEEKVAKVLLRCCDGVEYEPPRIRLDGVYYQPDFFVLGSRRIGWLPDRTIIEVKGVMLKSDVSKITEYLSHVRNTLAVVTYNKQGPKFRLFEGWGRKEIR